MNEYQNQARPKPRPNAQTHVHEFVGSVMVAEGVEPHTHRFAGVTSEVIPLPCGGHKHALYTNTDFYEKHYHEVAAETGPAICVGDGRHIHYVNATTTLNAGHTHDFIFATLIENPIGD
ncbi:YmaF family protein [Defluviitalea saccharophila]|uniref:YmaF family protein n=1 Tax=Defluviitalea saccharophila TaxID=879970 RepID=A0ABZ2Y567_9FIRM